MTTFGTKFDKVSVLALGTFVAYLGLAIFG